jgi:hypothetical protein
MARSVKLAHVVYYYRDPDGNRSELQVDCCANAEEARAFMASSAFAENPIGMEIDPGATAGAIPERHPRGAPPCSTRRSGVANPTRTWLVLRNEMNKELLS